MNKKQIDINSIPLEEHILRRKKTIEMLYNSRNDINATAWFEFLIGTLKIINDKIYEIEKRGNNGDNN